MECWQKDSTANPSGNIAHNVKKEVEDLMMVVGNGNYLVKPVMTDEQIEVLRQQIVMFATICEQLVEMHKSISAHQDAIAGTSLGNLYCDPLMINGNSPKIAPRQRWTPTQLQLQILENMFQLGNGTPSKQRIKEITSKLRPHGQISETNVYNWFQNRRARSKRKQATATEADDEGSKVIKGKSEQIGMSQSREGSSEVCESSVLNPGVNQLMRDHMETAEGFQLANRYNFF